MYSFMGYADTGSPTTFFSIESLSIEPLFWSTYSSLEYKNLSLMKCHEKKKKEEAEAEVSAET